MPDLPYTSYVLVFATAAVSGAINSVAGGGTLLTYPVLVSVGLDARIANATNTMALWPASAAAAWSFRSSLTNIQKWAVPFSVVSACGGAVGAVLLRITPTSIFESIVPWLILMAAVLFITYEHLMKRLGISPAGDDHIPDYTPMQWNGLMLAQFMVSVYGGYFGAGIGILMLATLGIMRFGGLFRINALKNVAAFLINAIAAVLFACLGLVEWRVSVVMAIGAIVGALLGAGVAKKIGPKALRIVISLLGFGLATYYMLKNFGVLKK